MKCFVDNQLEFDKDRLAAKVNFEKLMLAFRWSSAVKDCGLLECSWTIYYRNDCCINNSIR